MGPGPTGQRQQADAAGAELVVVDGLTKVYSTRHGEVRALDGVSFAVGAQEVVGLLGPNGAGKTTTIKSICGLVQPTSGRVMIDGIDALQAPRAAARRMAAVLEGNRTVYWRLSVRENLEFFAALRGLRRRDISSRIDELIERFHLQDKATTPAMRLSRGMQQKLAVACAVLPGTPLLLLDEPTLGLDVEISHELRDYLRRLAADEGRTILISSHDMQVVRDVCQRVVIINGGRVVADDSIDNLLALFTTRSFRISLSGSLSDTSLAGVRDRFRLCEVTRDDGRTLVDVSLQDSAGFYVLVDALRLAQAEIESFESMEPDLEKVFLSIVKADATP